MLWMKSQSNARGEMMLTDALLGEIIRRIVEIARPEKIILFGSAARGNMGPNSDVDLLVVKSGAHRRKLAGEIYMGLTGVGQAVDVIVVTPEDIRRYGHCPALVIEPAIREGRVVYAAQQAATG
jgi:predicted nucleotidyltransferase